ncbi:MAG: hypothetical protein IGR80_04020 [Synechococcales cyanobacterium K44_A2020_017]|nr:hypothetical protein [Synechococcales cyanobacterium K32_A2020_035]MBF2093906.1 hypothetical protein [Synechococcales cyanobacterium K44_A2020_017]
MYLHNGNGCDFSQVLALAPTKVNSALESIAHNNHKNDPDNHQEARNVAFLTDPLELHIRDVAFDLLGQTDRITIMDVVENVPAGESAVRNRLNALVESGQLDCLPGSGRRPSYYFLPSSKPSLQKVSVHYHDKAIMTDEELLEHLQHEELDLLEQIEVVRRDREALERVIELKRNLHHGGQEE